MELMTPQVTAGPDQPPPPRWRRFVPRPVRAFIWADEAAGYDAFLSYTWAADGPVATAIQGSLQQYLKPWYLTRARNIFRDLACLPAGSSLEHELRARLDRSKHLIVLAHPQAVTSNGMEFEIKHWASRPRAGHLIIVVTDGQFDDWQDLLANALPPATRIACPTAPLWVTISHRREEIVSRYDTLVRARLIEDLKQVFLRFYPDQDWDQLQGTERAQRHNAVRTLATVAVLLAFLAGFALFQYVEASRQSSRAEAAAQQEREARNAAEESARQARLEKAAAERSARFSLSRALALQSLNQRDLDAELALLLAGEAVDTTERDGETVPEAEFALRQAAQGFWRSRVIANVARPANSVVYSPDGRLFAVGARNGVSVYRSTDGALVRRVATPTAVFHVDFGPSSDVIASIEAGAMLRIIEIRTGKVRETAIGAGSGACPADSDLSAEADVTKAIEEGRDDGKSEILPMGVRYAGDGDTVVVTALQSDSIGRFPIRRCNALFTYGADSLSLLCKGKELGFSPGGLAVDSRGERAATAGYDAKNSDANIIRIWSLRRCEPEGMLRGHLASPWAMAFMPDADHLLVTGADDKTIRVWNTSSAQQVGSPVFGHDGGISALTFADHTRLVSAGKDGTVRVWEGFPFRNAHVLRSDGTALTSVSASVGAARILNTDAIGQVHAWTPPSLAPESKVVTGNSLKSVSMSPDAERIFAIQADGAAFEYSRRGGRPVRLTEEYLSFNDSAYDLDSGRLALAGRYARILDVPTKREAAYLLHKPSNWDDDEPDPSLTRVEFVANGRFVVGGNHAGYVTVMDARSGRPIGETRRYFANRELEKNRIYGMSAATERPRIAISALAGGVVLDIPSMTVVHQVPVPDGLEEEAPGVLSIALDRTGTTVAAGFTDGTVVLSGLQPGAKARSFAAHGSAITDLAFDATGRFIATGALGGDAVVWDLQTLTVTARMEHARNPISRVRFHSTQPELMVSSEGGNIAWYRFDLPNLRKQVSQLTGRTFTQTECERFLQRGCNGR